MSQPIQSILADKLQARVDAAIMGIERRLRDMVDKLAMDGELVAYDASNVQALDRAAKELTIEMRRLGVDEILADQQAALDDIMQEIEAEFEAAGIPNPVLGPTREMVQRLMSQATDDLTQAFDAGSTVVQRYISSATMGGVKRTELVSRIQQALDTTAARAKTSLDTALHSFHRTVTVTHARDVGIAEFAYLGPSDERTREWCSHWVDRRATAKEFEATGQKWGHDRQPTPVMAWGGGWNCRHRFVPIVGDLGNEFKRGPR